MGKGAPKILLNFFSCAVILFHNGGEDKQKKRKNKGLTNVRCPRPPQEEVLDNLRVGNNPRRDNPI